MGRLRRFLSPAAGRADRRLRRRVVPREPSPRDRRRVLRPARLHPVRRVERAGGGDGGAQGVPRRPRRPDLPVRGHARAVHRRRPDGVLQRPGALRRRAAAGDPDGAWRCARGSAGWPRPGRGRVTTSRWASAIAQGYATLGRIGFEGRFDYAAIGSVTNLAARLCADRRAVADPGHRAGVLRGRVARGRRGRRHARAERLQPRRPHVQRQGRRQLADRVMTGDLWTPPTPARTCCRP